MSLLKTTPTYNRSQVACAGSEPSMKYLNLGCGHRFHPAWTNIDFSSTGEGVIAHNLTQGIPYPNDSVAVLYHSHILEHFTKSGAIEFLQECYRVLEPNGILRVVVPDLEQIARTYLTALEQANSGSKEWQHHYDWIMLELFDQTVRNHSGGDMLKYLVQPEIPNEAFVVDRCGTEAKKLIAAGREPKSGVPPENRFKQRLKNLYELIRNPQYRREKKIQRLLGKEYATLQIGRFRQGGEVHQWMYDRYSLSQLLHQCGFQAVTQQTATKSNIVDWSTFHLDTEPDGSIYKPDSLFMEAVKPAS